MPKEIFISESFPSPLYKAFTQEQHAYDFLEQGNLILQPLKYFRNIEDINRKDKDEGKGKAEIIMKRPVLQIDKYTGQLLSSKPEPGPVYFVTSTPNPCYIISFSGPQVDLNYLIEKYGQYVLRINEPNKLVKAICSNLSQSDNMPNVMWLECIQVRYDKGQLTDNLPEPGSQERARMSYGQKASNYSRDCEYRLVLKLPIPTLNIPKVIYIELHTKLDYVDILKKDTK